MAVFSPVWPLRTRLLVQSSEALSRAMGTHRGDMGLDWKQPRGPRSERTHAITTRLLKWDTPQAEGFC